MGVCGCLVYSKVSLRDIPFLFFCWGPVSDSAYEDMTLFIMINEVKTDTLSVFNNLFFLCVNTLLRGSLLVSMINMMHRYVFGLPYRCWYTLFFSFGYVAH